MMSNKHRKVGDEKQQSIFNKRNIETVNNTKASYIVSSLIAEKMKPFTDSKFVKEYLMNIVDIVCPEKRTPFENISLSVRTFTRRIEGMATDVKEIGSLIDVTIHRK